MNGLGCIECRHGWRGYNLAEQLVACPNCRPHAIRYLRQHDRDALTTVIPNPPSPGEEIPMPEWFKSTVDGYRRLARERQEAAEKDS